MQFESESRTLQRLQIAFYRMPKPTPGPWSTRTECHKPGFAMAAATAPAAAAGDVQLIFSVGSESS